MARETERRREVITGAFVLVGLAAVTFMVVLLGSQQRISRSASPSMPSSAR